MPKAPFPATLRFAGVECRLLWGRYREGGVALQLSTPEGEPMARVTSNPWEADLAADEVLVGGDVTRLGHDADLLASGLFADTGRTHRSGFSDLKVYRLLAEPPAWHGGGAR